MSAGAEKAKLLREVATIAREDSEYQLAAMLEDIAKERLDTPTERATQALRIVELAKGATPETQPIFKRAIQILQE